MLTLEDVDDLERERTLAASEGSYIILHPKRAKKIYALARARLEAQEGDGGELVERLREGSDDFQTSMALRREAADALTAKEAELSALKADNERMRDDIEAAVDTLEAMDLHIDNPLYDRLRSTLEHRAALGKGGE